MTFRDDDDDTSAGKTTQGGSAPRRGNAIFLALGGAVILLAVVLALVSLPKKRSAVENGTAPVSSGVSAPGPAGPVVPPTSAPR